MMKTLNKYWIFNGDYQAMPESGAEKLFKDGYAYEVIRFVEGKPIFLEDHINRLLNTCRKSCGETAPDFELLKNEIIQLVEKEQLQNINVKIVITEGQRAVYAIESHYPSAKEYKEGVNCKLLFRERKNPDLKIYQAELRKEADKIKQQSPVFESLLVNQKGEITEGSKSNIFFIKGHRMYTAPNDLVLSGITRQKIIEIAISQGIQVVYKAVNYKELSDYEAAFISGTSPSVLSIRQIQSQSFDADNSILKMIQKAYFGLITNN